MFWRRYRHLSRHLHFLIRNAYTIELQDCRQEEEAMDWEDAPVLPEVEDAPFVPSVPTEDEVPHLRSEDRVGFESSLDVTNAFRTSNNVYFYRLFYRREGVSLHSRGCPERCSALLVEWLRQQTKLPHLSEANPQVYVETPLHPEKLTVWCALLAGGIIGPYFKNDEGHNVTVNGDRYRAMITNFFIPELNDHDV
ncbi:uncharacterized protein TNCV_3353311 [Trichonephila clavipes]|nr:uncharacterized protein TNCV_3353311 [Trichonephila clavipes]